MDLMQSTSPKVLLLLLFVSMGIACTSDEPAEQLQDHDTANSILVAQGLLDRDWTLETVRDDAGNYRPLPLEAIWRIRFEADGRLTGNALCNDGHGSWQTNDESLSIVNWFQTEIDCESSNLVPIETNEVISRFYSGEITMPSIDSGRLLLATGNNEQLVFSGRAIRPAELPVPVETFVRTDGGSRASNASPVFGDLETPYVVYRDTESLSADFALLPEEESPWPELPPIDFTNSIVIGAYLPLDSAISSDIVVRHARIAATGLEIEIAHFGPDVPDDIEAGNCGADSALSAPWTLVRIESTVEPVIFAEMARAYCTGIPARDP